MKTFTYQSGEEVKPGDRVMYFGEPGEVEFVVAEETGETPSFGAVFVTEIEDLEFVSRSTSSPS